MKIKCTAEFCSERENHIKVRLSRQPEGEHASEPDRPDGKFVDSF